MKKLRRLLMLSGLGIIVATGALVLSLNIIERSSAALVSDDTESVPHKRVALILGCAPSRNNGAPNLYFRNRIAAAVELFNAGKVDYLLASGDNRTIGYDEPTAMKDALVAAGVPESRIVLDYAGFRTLDSVVRAKKVFGLSDMCIITQRDHAMRALYIAKANGIEAVGFAAADVRTMRGGLRTKVRESFARVVMLLDVHVLGRKPRFLGPEIAIGSDLPAFRASATSTSFSWKSLFSRGRAPCSPIACSSNPPT